jgi:hypothetical protein
MAFKSFMVTVELMIYANERSVVLKSGKLIQCSLGVVLGS